MEWVLQVLDEIDDVIGVLRHGWLGIHVRVPAGISLALGPAAGAGTSSRAVKVSGRSPQPRAASNPL
jgi:hypothetical protein